VMAASKSPDMVVRRRAADIRWRLFSRRVAKIAPIILDSLFGASHKSENI